MLDRLSIGSPSAGQRAYSPAGRHPSSLARGGSRLTLGPRSSSLSVLSRANSSTDSLPRLNRAPNGSTLRQEVPYFEDPLEVLQKIVDAPLPLQPDSSEIGSSAKPETVSQDIDFGGLSLEEFAARSPRATKRARASSVKSAEECEYVPRVCLYCFLC